MNSLEWINKQIEECKQAIQQLKIRIDEDKNYPSFIKCHNERLKELKPILQTLQQIKTELEAWYEIKNLYLKGYFSRVVLPVESDKKFKKALELKNNES